MKEFSYDPEDHGMSPEDDAPYSVEDSIKFGQIGLEEMKGFITRHKHELVTSHDEVIRATEELGGATLPIQQSLRYLLPERIYGGGTDASVMFGYPKTLFYMDEITPAHVVSREIATTFFMPTEGEIIRYDYQDEINGELRPDRMRIDLLRPYAPASSQGERIFTRNTRVLKYQDNPGHTFLEIGDENGRKLEDPQDMHQALVAHSIKLYSAFAATLAQVDSSH